MKLIHWINVHLQNDGTFNEVHLQGLTQIEKLIQDSIYKCTNVVILDDGFLSNRWFKISVVVSDIEYTVGITGIFNDILVQCSEGYSKNQIEYSLKSALNQEVKQTIDLEKNTISYKFD